MEIGYYFPNVFSLNSLKPLFMLACTDQTHSSELPCSDMYFGCTIHLLMECSERIFFPFTNTVAVKKKDLFQVSLYTFRTRVVCNEWDLWVNRYYTYFKLKNFPKLLTTKAILNL